MTRGSARIPRPTCLHRGCESDHTRSVAPIGKGGMGEVWRGRDARLGRDVALKFVAAAGADRLARFEDEARTLAALNHPNICVVYDVGPDFIAMELVEGAPLLPDPQRSCTRAGRPGRADRRRPRRCPQRRHRPSRPQARQRAGQQRRPCEDRGLRPRKVARSNTLGCRRDAGDGPHASGHDPWYRRLHEPGAGARRSRGRHAIRSVQLRADPLRTGRRSAGLHARNGRRDAVGDHPRGSSAASAGRACAAALDRRIAASPRSPKDVTTRRAVSISS